MQPTTWTRLARSMLPGSNPSYLIAFVTGRCPLRCRGCCQAARGSRGSTEMDVAQWTHALQGLRNLIHLTITGGEPFQRRDLAQLVTAMVRTTGAPRYSLNTSGQDPERVAACTRELLERLPGRDATLFLSVDGPPALHDQLRGCEGAYRAVERAVGLLEAVRSAHPSLSVRLVSVLQPENLGRLDQLLEETDRWPMDHHEIAMLRDVPASVQRGLLDEYARLSELQLARVSTRFGRGMDWRLARLLRREVIQRVASPERARPCLAGRHMVEILPDGTVLGCELAKVREQAELGTVAQGERLVDVLRGQATQDFRRLAAGCSCSFECAATCDIVFRPQRWTELL
jgi:MoaA/NifB/PqqE/SkfB family radical SAM enzyme